MPIKRSDPKPEPEMVRIVIETRKGPHADEVMRYLNLLERRGRIAYLGASAGGLEEARIRLWEIFKAGYDAAGVYYRPRIYKKTNPHDDADIFFAFQGFLSDQVSQVDVLGW